MEFHELDTPSQRWHCKMGWTSKPSAVCSATMTLDSHSAPTPTLRGRSRTKPHKRWAASWRKRCKQKKDAKYRRGGKTSSPVLFEPIRTFSRVGHGVGQAVDPHFDPHHFRRFCSKKAPKTEVFDAFLSGGFNSDIFVLEALHRNGFEFSIEFRMRLFQIFSDAIRTPVRIQHEYYSSSF